MKKRKSTNTCCGWNLSFCGWFFVIIGAFFLAQFLGWIPQGVPFWSVFLILFGIYLLTKYYKK